MVRGLGPHITGQAQTVDSYRRASVNLTLRIESYIGVPIYRNNGSLFGTLCAIDPSEQGLEPERILTEVQDAVGIVTESLERDLNLLEGRLEHYRDPEKDGRRLSSGSINERSFCSALEVEERLCAEFGERCTIAVTRIESGEHLRRGYSSDKTFEQCTTVFPALRRVMGPSDLLADFGGGLVVMLLRNVGPEQAVALRNVLETVLRGAGRQSTVHLVSRRRDGTAGDALDSALELAKASSSWNFGFD
jgi:hypothetical protein